MSRTTMTILSTLLEAIVLMTTAIAAGAVSKNASDDLRLLPYPQHVERLPGRL